MITIMYCIKNCSFKKRILFITFEMFMFICIALSCNYIYAATFTNKNDELWVKNHYGKEINKINFNIIRHPLQDYRLIYCSYEVLTERKKKTKCLIDVFGWTMKKGVYDKSKEEILLSPEDTVRTVLDKAGFKHWESGQPQLRLVGRNCIMQSPLKYSSDISYSNMDLKRFMAMPVRPGDIIVISAVE